ncbi:MAG: nucleotidyltransferase [Pyrinomonadaceae bacterium]
MLNQNFKDVLSAFSAEKVEFMVVGGYAMAFHGFVRATGDIDLWIRCSEENAAKVWKALQKFGAPLFDLKTEDLQTPGMVFQIGIVPSRIDVITQIDGVDFEDAWKEHKIIEIEGLKIPVIGKAHLLVNKKSTGRSKDRNDVLWLESE